MQVNTYLSFNGQCEEAFRFYGQTLDAKIMMIMKYGESPMAGQTPPEQHNRVMHASMTIDGQAVMGADAPADHFKKPQGFSMSLGIADPAEAERIFQALAEKGQVLMPIQKTFWAQKFGMLIDRFGTPWMVNCEQPAGGGNGQ